MGDHHNHVNAGDALQDASPQGNALLHQNDNQRTIPKQDRDCKMTDVKYSGNIMAWKMVCTGKSTGKGEGEIVYKGATAYEGSMDAYDQQV